MHLCTTCMPSVQKARRGHWIPCNWITVENCYVGLGIGTGSPEEQPVHFTKLSLHSLMVFFFFKILLSKPFVISICLCFVTSELLLLFYMIGFPGSYSIWFVSFKILFSSCFTCIFYVSCFNHICWPFAVCLCAYTKHSASVSTSNLKEY